MLKDYYYLTKPGIIYGNILTTIAGFLLASRFHIQLGLFLATIAGTSFVIGSACVVNNYLDREIDKKMERTKSRALVQDRIDIRLALSYAFLLFIIGNLLLIEFVNILVFIIGLIAFFIYVVVYGIAKRRSIYGTIVGSLAGAAPIVGGYCAVSDKLNLTAVILFLIMVFWQMPHFYAIAIYRKKDYKSAGLPVWPIVRGNESTKRQIILFIILFILANIALSIFGPTKFIYALILILIGTYWLRLGILNNSSIEKWARKMFLFSLIVVLLMSIGLSIGSLIA